MIASSRLIAERKAWDLEYFLQEKFIGSTLHQEVPILFIT
jgi:hypothetical protein